MTKPFLTLGMAVYDDMDGCYMTTQALRMYQDLSDCEVLVIDNKPDSPSSKYLGFVNAQPNARLIQMPEAIGTTQPRNRVFQEAQGDYVVCMDSHVLLKPQAVERLKAYYRGGGHERELVSGPILWDNLVNGSTHFDDYWRSEMWGIWGQAWECVCSKESFMRDHFHFCILQDPGEQFCRYWSLVPSKPLADTICPRCGRKLPDRVPFGGHEAVLRSHGYRMLGFDDQDQPFEIPAHGLGLFSAKKTFWEELGGFNPDFRGFGGEEMYIHEKVRRAGGKNMCLPFLAWGHRFARPNGVKFPLRRFDKVRNYVLGALELDDKVSLGRIEEHFVGGGLMSREQWDKLLADPTSTDVPPVHQQVDPGSGRPMPPNGVGKLDELLAWCRNVPRDVNEHLPVLAEYAGRCHHVTEFTGRRESTVGLLAGVYRNNGLLRSYNTEGDKLLDLLVEKYNKNVILSVLDIGQVRQIEPTDMLFLNSGPHTYARVWDELQVCGSQVGKYIALHNTMAFGANGQDGGGGLWDAMKQWMKENLEWFICYHSNNQYGFTILSKVPEDKPANPIRPWPKGAGPGTEMKAILHSLGINPSPSCDCNRKAYEMDELGVAGCREKFDELVAGIKDGMHRWGWKDQFSNFAKAGFKAMLSGLAWDISWTDPIPDLVRKAIEQAAQKGDE